MRTFYSIGPLLLLLFTFGCGRSVKVTPPLPDQKPVETTHKEEVTNDQKDRLETREQASEEEAGRLKNFLKKSSEYQRKLDKLNGSLLRKRGEGYNTSEAESKLKQIEEGLKNAKRLNVEGKVKELQAQLQELETWFKQAGSLVKDAPRFGEQPIKKDQIQRKYDSITQEQVREKRGEPKTKQPIGMFSLNLFLTDPTDILSGSLCFDGDRTFTIQNPPHGEIWTYDDGTIYVFIETNGIVEGFLLRNDLESYDRDRLLVQLCPAQVYSGAFRLVLVSEVGQPVTDASIIWEQIFTGKWRMADMFGLGGMERIVRATAALPDLTIAALAFNVNLQPLNQQQNEQLQKFGALIADIDPEMGVVLNEISKNNASNLPPEEKAKKNEEILRNRPAMFQKRYEAVKKIIDWQRNLHPDKNHIKDAVKVYPQYRQEIEEIGGAFRETLLQLKEEFDLTSKKLHKFEVQPPELAFKETDHVTIFFSADGVRFNETTLPDGSKVEVADLSFKVMVKITQGKKRAPLLIKESAEILIKSVNNYIEAVKEYRRLASFGIAFPFDLPLGTYEVTIVLTDHLRVQSTQKTVKWSVVPAEFFERN